jgi:hypothetical protein
MRKVTLLIIILLLVAPIFKAQADGSSDPFKQFIIDNVNGVADSLASPFSKIFSTGVTGGMYRGASTHSLLGFDVGFRAMLVRIPSGESVLFDSADVKLFPVPVVQASVGLPMNIEVMVRGFGVKYQGSNITLFGASLKKDFSDLIPLPMFPNVSAFIGYHKFKAGYKTFTVTIDSNYFGNTEPVNLDVNAGSFMSSSHLSYGLIVSKKFGGSVFSVQPYAGFSLDHSTVTYKFITTNTTPGTLYYNDPVPTDAKNTVNTSRFTVGVDLQPMPVLHLVADYSFTKYPTASLGLTFSIR